MGKKWILSLILPPLALGIFYLPILDKFLGCIRLGEGWFSRTNALYAMYSGAFFPVAVSAFFAMIAAVIIFRKSRGWVVRFRILCDILILLLPAGAILLTGKRRPRCIAGSDGNPGRSAEAASPGGNPSSTGRSILWAPGMDPGRSRRDPPRKSRCHPCRRRTVFAADNADGFRTLLFAITSRQRDQRRASNNNHLFLHRHFLCALCVLSWHCFRQDMTLRQSC